MVKKRCQNRNPSKGKDIDIENLSLIESLEDEFDLREARRVLETLEEDGTTSFDELKKELGI